MFLLPGDESSSLSSECCLNAEERRGEEKLEEEKVRMGDGEERRGEGVEKERVRRGGGDILT